jgi:hypothetical protein
MPGLKFPAWERELEGDLDRDFILEGVKGGFHIIDPTSDPVKVEVGNHPSASPSSPLYAQATVHILQEIEWELPPGRPSASDRQPHGGHTETGRRGQNYTRL